jgi:hypothetical protein
MKALPLYTIIIAFILFIILFGCIKEFSFENNNASGTLRDSAGMCFTEKVYGTFYNGVAPADTAYVEVKVNVFKAGNYNIHTDLQNGVRFADSGTFENTGINTIKLKPEGKPLLPTSDDFNIFFDTSICAVTINIRDSNELSNHAIDTLPLNNWQFTDTKRNITYHGVLQKNYILTLGLLKVLVLSSKNAQQEGDSTFMINIALPHGIIETGTYTSDDPPNGIVFKTFSDACINCAGGGLIPLSSGATVVFIITGYDATTKIVKGTFSGTTIDVNEEIATIKEGAFTGVVE